MTQFLSMPLEEAMSTQKAIRRLKEDPVDDELLLHLLELAMKAPVGSNRQNWEFLVVKDPQVKARLGELNRQAVGLYFRFAPLMGKPSASTEKIMSSVRWQMDHFDSIPVVVVACYHSIPPPFIHVLQTSYFGSVYPAVQNLLLAARAAGLGAALITLPLWSPRRVRHILGLPGNITPCAVIPMGWPLGKYGPVVRKPVGDVVHIDRYGNQPYRSAAPATPSRSRWPWWLAAAALGLGAALYLNRDEAVTSSG